MCFLFLYSNKSQKEDILTQEKDKCFIKLKIETSC